MRNQITSGIFPNYSICIRTYSTECKIKEVESSDQGASQFCNMECPHAFDSTLLPGKESIQPWISWMSISTNINIHESPHRIRRDKHYRQRVFCGLWVNRTHVP